MPASRPNVIVVLADQLRRDALSFMGDPNVRTPNIDAMAAEGVVFEAMSSTFPTCVPFRFSMLTGEYAHSRAVPALGYRLSPAERTIGDVMVEAGHATAYIGKWHLDTLYGITGGQSLVQANRRPIPKSHRRGFEHWRGFELRNSFFDTCYFADDDPEPKRIEGYQTDGLFDLAHRYIETERPKDRPFFMILSVEAPHPPFEAPEPSVDAVRARGPLRHRPNVDIAGIRFFPPEWHAGGGFDPTDPEERRRIFDANMEGYAAMIDHIDMNMGRLRATLERTGLAGDTIVVFLADHGELGGSHGLLGKGEPYEESIGVPLIVWSANPDLVKGGRRSALPLGTEDLFPTFAGLAGLSPSPRAPQLDLAPFIRGEAAEPDRDGVLLEFVAEVRPNRAYYDETWRGIRTRRHKYTVIGNHDGTRPWQLFDLEADPFEQHNLVDDPGSAALTAQLHDRLRQLLIETADDYPLSGIAY